MDDHKLDEILENYANEKQVEIPEKIRKNFKGRVLDKLDIPFNWVLPTIGLVSLVVLVATLLWVNINLDKQDLIPAAQVANTEQLKQLSIEDEMQSLLEGLSEDELLDLITELEGDAFLIELGGTFYADEIELLDAVSLNAATL